jgi:isopenicillin N synthase-like dioxygenase
VSRVPVIDLSAPTSESIAALDAACRDHGFFLISGHGADEVIAKTWAQTERFFDAGSDVFEPLRRTEGNPMGYFDRELTKRKRDHKAVFDYLDPNTPARDEWNRWPQNLPGFRQAMVDFHTEFTSLTCRTLALLHDVLELGPDSQSQMSFDPMISSVRLNHYPVGDPVPTAERDGLIELGETALGYHTDPGTITLLLQDDTGGLQTQDRDGNWIDVAPQAGTIVVNLADAVQVQTNDRWRAAVHRVVPMTNDRRFSIPYFGNPSRHSTIQPLPELAPDARYRAFDWSEFMAARTADNFADIGAEDAQISDYLVSASS